MTCRVPSGPSPVKLWVEGTGIVTFTGAGFAFVTKQWVNTTAPVTSHAEPFYESLPPTVEKAYLELNDADHRVGTRGDTTMARSMIAWLKRYVDDDTRYEPFLCPPPAAGGAVEEYRHTCPG